MFGLVTFYCSKVQSVMKIKLYKGGFWGGLWRIYGALSVPKMEFSYEKKRFSKMGASRMS